MSPVSAEKLMQTAWDLGALLPGIGALLGDGTLTYPKARAVNDALELLSETDKARAEAMIAGRLGGKTSGRSTSSPRRPRSRSIPTWRSGRGSTRSGTGRGWS